VRMERPERASPSLDGESSLLPEKRLKIRVNPVKSGQME